MWNTLFLLLLFFNVAASQTIIDTLPGYPGTLPFKMETGYIGVGEMDDVQLFYYFFESERDPIYDPVMLWLTGGPGCSGFSAIAFETGPLAIAWDTYTGGLPSLKYNPFSWTKVASIIYIDQPVGSGFSYATTTDAANSSDILAPIQAYNFLRKWLVNHPKYLGNQIYIGGDSYSGLIVPQLVQHVLQGIESGLKPHIDLQGYVLGNPVTDYQVDQNSRIPFVHRVSLISDEYYEDAKLNCNGDYINVDTNNTKCVLALQNIMSSLLQIKLTQILEPQCAFTSKKPAELEWDILSQEQHFLNLLQDAKLPELRCREFGYALSYKYMNNDTVQSALGVRNGTVENWSRCLKVFSTYTEVVESIVYVHKNLSKTGLRALIYSGDHDISVPYVGTLEWIKSLEIPVFDEWRPWYVDGQVAGYQTKFMNSNFRLTYATIKGGGHTAPEYKPEECLALVDRFFARYPI
ncbi:serine carboxypeptidase-like 18 [Euphorbia lathyris]|uniref:serine carboxypeptidase-like 18 n=1 Tax=Euphorbia lathyris TaxID=212925 RepID=UPI0033134DEA